ncbi:hypothetical protein NVV24_13390 [Acinetobacter radioresistens]|uniref:hypothetical protein n=1 Tax=Acinetobacter radioresistens TaxID=40216 RepID=UPI002246660A|nr:hypothetical protein [Acinetobacter radioresistens]MCX0343632.1 hypothetical protein [Acinetobacter radioresistens]
MDQNNSETQDNVDTATTENNSVDSQEHEEQQEGGQSNEPETKEGEGKDEETPEDKPKPRNRAQERIQQLAREKAEMAAKLAEYEAQKKAPKPLEAPMVEDFEDYSDFQKAQQDWFIEQAEQRVMAKIRQEQEQQSSVQQKVAFESAVSELEEEGVDVEGLMKKAETLPPLPVTLDQFGLSAKEALTLAADLLQNEELYHELASMNPYQASMRIGQIIGSKQSKPAAPPVQKAPKPINPVQANAPVKRSAESMSDQEFLKSRGL